ncbi:MAG: hypothetical protein U1E25_05870 [Methylocystis sp.]
MTHLGSSSNSPHSHEELLRRLEEAEETIRAIREGEVDALVIRRTKDEEIFTLQGGQDSYRAFMETMCHGAAALGARGEVLYANAVLTALIGKPLFRLQGQLLVDRFAEPASSQLRACLRMGRSGSGSSSAISVPSTEERFGTTSRPEPLQIGVVGGWAFTLTDLTDRVRGARRRYDGRTGGAGDHRLGERGRGRL